MTSMRRRIIFDIALTIALVFEMLYQVTGNLLHEVVGAAFFACIVAHIAFAAKWIKNAVSSLSTRELASKQRKLLAIAVLLAIDVIVLIVSSVIISQTLWDAGIDLTALNPGNIWYPIHTGAAYVMCILVLGHLAMHWNVVVDSLKIPYDPSRRESISSALNGIVLIGGIALGITGTMRAGFQASDYVSSSDGDEDSSTVQNGYREVNAQTGEYIEDQSFDAASLSDATSSSEATAAETESEATICPLCPRRCKLTAPPCHRPNAWAVL